MRRIFAAILLLAFLGAGAQNAGTDSIAKQRGPALKFDYKPLIVPTALIGYGIIGLGSDQLLFVNSQIKEEITENIDRRITVDDFSQYAPAFSVYALNAAGVQGKNDFRDRTVVIATSYLILSATVLSLKTITKVERPDGSSHNSFPSGHTATAFAGAEFLWQEYKDVSIWYGIGGYVVAAGTGVFRMYNNRHWLTDVAAGAGIGMLSTKAAYWLYPKVNKLISGKSETKKTASSAAMPFYDGRHAGLCMAFKF